MKTMNKVLAVSILAMLAVPAAHAKIVAETMLSETSGHYSSTHTVQDEIDAKATKATTLSGYGITDAYTKTETGTQITNAVNALDSTSTGTGTVVKGVSQTDGKVAVTVGTISNADVASDAAIAGTKVAAATTTARGTIEIATDAEATAGSLENVAVNPKQLKAAAAAAQAAATPGIATTSATGVVKGGGNVAIANDGTMSVDLSGKADKATTLSGYGITDAYTKTETGTQITNAVNALDSTSTGTGTVVKGVSQTDGKVAVTVGTISNADVASDAAIAQSKISGLSTSLSGKVDVAQGSGNKDKVMITDATNGDVTTTAFVHQAGYNATDSNRDNTIPSVKTVQYIVNQAAGDYVALDQTTDNKDKAMITNGTGQVVPGQIATGMIADSAVTSAKIANGTITTSDISSSAGITKGQLASAVQTSLDKADSALQASDVTSTYSATGTAPVNGTAVASAISGVAATANGAVQTDQTTTNKNKVMSTTSTGQVTASTITGTNGVSASVADDGSVSVSGTAATGNAFGVVKTGTNITNSSGTISVATANGSTLGVVKQGTNVTISSGSVSVADASTDAMGVIEIATDSEASTGTATNLAVTPKQLKTVADSVTTTNTNKQDKIGGTAGKLVVTTATAGNVTYTDAVPTSIPATPSTDGVFVLTAKNANGTTTFYWEDIGR